MAQGAPETPTSPRTAVILAAGSGDRLSGKAPLKPLLKVGGLTLIERTVLTLQRAGISDFRVVVGSKAEQTIAAMRELKRLRGLNVTFVECPDWQQGNGVSLSRGAAGVRGSFLVSMADHVTDGQSAKRLIAEGTARPGTPKLATDPRVAAVFDLDDATKVKTENGRIAAIGKDLKDYDQIDTGLFYFPAGAAERLEALRAAGARQVSDFVRTLAAETEQGGFEVVPVEGFWQDVDTPAMAKEAERRMLTSLIKPTDGPVSRHLNRAVSLRVTRVLARLDVYPNTVTTFVFLLSLAAAAMAAGAGSYATLALSGVLFQVASIIDGCDGELSRYQFKGSRFGAWYDTLTDNIRYATFYCALGVYSYRQTHHALYLWAVGLFVLVAVYFVSMMARKLLAEDAPGTHLVILAKTKDYVASGKAGWFERVVWPLRFLVKQDVIALIVMFGLLCAQAAAIFWIGLVGLVVMTIQVQRALRPAEDAAESPSRVSQSGSFIMFVAGVAILAAMLTRAPLSEIADTLSAVGLKAFLVFGIALTWLLLNTLSLSALVDHEVGVMTLLHNRLVGEAINNLVPLAGVAGEPYKIKHLASYLPLDRATHAVVSDKLINTIAGFLFFVAVGIPAVVLLPLPKALAVGMAVLIALSVVAGVALAVAVNSELQGRALSRLMRRFGLGEFNCPPLRRRTFAVALTYNFLGRAAALLEVVALFSLLGVSTDAVHVLGVAAVLSATSILFFVIPQGIGVAEAGVTGTFLLLGLPAHLGVTFALLRRGRIIFWALVGLVLFALHGLLSRLRGPVEMEAGRLEISR